MRCVIKYFGAVQMKDRELFLSTWIVKKNYVMLRKETPNIFRVKP